MKLRLKLIGNFIGNSLDRHENREPAIYSVEGLSPEDCCIIGYAGMKNGQRRWSLGWYRNGDKVAAPEETFASAEDALAEAEKIRDAGK